MGAKRGESCSTLHTKGRDQSAINTVALHECVVRSDLDDTASVEHEATTSKIGEDQLFYCLSRGISAEDAINMIVNGFCKEVFKQLPMEFAVEAQKLISISLEGSVG